MSHPADAERATLSTWYCAGCQNISAFNSGICPVCGGVTKFTTVTTGHTITTGPPADAGAPQYTDREVMAKVRVLNPIIVEVYQTSVSLDEAKRIENYICGPAFEALCNVLRADGAAPSPQPQYQKPHDGSVQDDIRCSFATSTPPLTAENLELQRQAGAPLTRQGADLDLEPIKSRFRRHDTGELCREHHECREVAELVAEVERLRSLAVPQPEIQQLLTDHSIALEFVRELSRTGCDCAFGAVCLSCKATKWLHSESRASLAERRHETTSNH